MVTRAHGPNVESSRGSEGLGKVHRNGKKFLVADIYDITRLSNIVHVLKTTPMFTESFVEYSFDLKAGKYTFAQPHTTSAVLSIDEVNGWLHT